MINLIKIIENHFIMAPGIIGNVVPPGLSVVKQRRIIGIKKYQTKVLHLGTIGNVSPRRGMTKINDDYIGNFVLMKALLSRG